MCVSPGSEAVVRHTGILFSPVHHVDANRSSSRRISSSRACRSDRRRSRVGRRAHRRSQALCTRRAHLGVPRPGRALPHGRPNAPTFAPLGIARLAHLAQPMIRPDQYSQFVTAYTATVMRATPSISQCWGVIEEPRYRGTLKPFSTSHGLSLGYTASAR
jgi:hypothetical protein